MSRQAVDGLRSLHEYWIASLAALKWRSGESDDDYKAAHRRASSDDLRGATPERDRARCVGHRAASAHRRRRRRAAREKAAPLTASPLRRGRAARARRPRHRPRARRRSSAKAARSRARCPASASASSSSRWRRRSRDAIRERGQLVAEAGTGTGKTFAYLVPALLDGGKVIVSTGTKTLQDQLFERDLPLVRDALARARHHRAAQGARELRLPPPPRARVARGPAAVARRRAPPAQDRRLRRAPPTAATARSSPTCPRTRRSGRSSPRRATTASAASARHFRECFVMKARKEALDADVVIVNHHLFFADVMLRDEGLAELLPACNTVILDEAHQLPDTATLFFGEQMTAGQLAELARDAEVTARTELRDVPGPARCRRRSPAARSASCASPPASCPGKFPREAMLAREDFAAARSTRSPPRSTASRPSSACSRSAARRSANLAARADDLARRLARWRDAAGRARTRAATRRRVDPLGRRHAVYGWQLQASPLSVGAAVPPPARREARAWIFTSATLAVGRDFSHYTARLGLDGAQTGCWDSPFDYPQPGAAVRAARAAGAEPAGAHRCRGRRRAAGHRGGRRPRVPALHHAARARARARAAAAGLRRARASTIPLLVQGEGVEDRAARRASARSAMPCCWAARASGKASTCPGEALSLVVIDKLPFAPPDDPLIAARLDAPQGRGRQSVPRLPAAAGRDRAQAGRGAADPHGDRPRRADDLRPAARREAVRQDAVAQPAADGADAGDRGRGGVLRRSPGCATRARVRYQNFHHGFAVDTGTR